ncbi:MAG: alkaline phosphatase family protein, partial [Nitrospirae bacterium]|nr:alkaline phosphatase family protein [Nitrospirota bacterium]
MNNKKVFVFGIDGATFDIIIPLIQKGKLPNLARMVQTKAYGNLTSTIPPNSSVAWTSFATGKNAGKHGIYYFRERKANSYERPFISSHSIKSKTIWKILSEYGKKVGVINVPIAYPPEVVNGYMISGLLAPNRKSIFTYPPRLHFELLEKLGDYPLDNEAEIIYHSSGDEISAFQHLIYSNKKVMEATFYLMDKFEWDFFVVVLTLADKVQHIAWKYTIPEFRKQYPELCMKFENMIEVSYSIVDEQLGRLKERLDNNTNLIILSDHGFGSISYQFYVNIWLNKLGLLNLKKYAVMKYRFQESIKTSLKSFLTRFGKKVGMTEIMDKVINIPFLNMNNEKAYTLVDWSRTKAFSSWTNGEEIILINLKGREPEGIVDHDNEYEELRDFIIKRLEEVRGENGEKVVDRAYKREELYSGPYVYLAPDIQFTTMDMSIQPRGKLTGKDILVRPSDFSPALHRMNGIFIIEGEGIKEHFRIEGAHIIDIAPTVLYLLGLPIPNDIDGRVITSCFKEEYLKENAIQRSEHPSSSSIDTEGGKTYTEDEKKQLAEALKG